MRNRPTIEKCILSFSHNRYESRREADRIGLGKARREIAQGKRGISHLILRAEDDRIDRLKFLFLVNGIPLMCYALGNVLLSSVREIAVVGSPEVKAVLDLFKETVDCRGKTIHFVPEDPDNLILISTLLRGRDALTLEKNELVLFQPGDLPFLYELEKVVQDRDIRSNNLIMWLNSREAMFGDYLRNPESEFVQRNYHYRCIDEKENCLHDVKEPNVYPINLTAIEGDIIELLHETRKDGKILNAFLSKALREPKRMLKMLPVVAHHFRKFDKDLKKFRREDEFKFGMHLKNFNRGMSTLLNTQATSKFHNDPAFVADVDALEDWEDYESLVHIAGLNHGEDGLAKIHPFGRELLTFREKAMPTLKLKLPMYTDFHGYINEIYRSQEMGYMPFDKEGRYDTPNLHTPMVEQAYRWYGTRASGFERNR